MSEVKRKKGESFEGFMRRVKQGWLKSGRIRQAKKVQFRTKTASKNVKRKNAVKRSQITGKQTYLRKIGRLPPEENRFNKR